MVPLDTHLLTARLQRNRHVRSILPHGKIFTVHLHPLQIGLGWKLYRMLAAPAGAKIKGKRPLPETLTGCHHQSDTVDGFRLGRTQPPDDWTRMVTRSPGQGCHCGCH